MATTLVPLYARRCFQHDHHWLRWIHPGSPDNQVKGSKATTFRATVYTLVSLRHVCQGLVPVLDTRQVQTATIMIRSLLYVHGQMYKISTIAYS